LLGIGLKYKLFAFIFLSLIFLSAIILVIQGVYFENERLLLLDEQIRSSAENIVDSEFVNLEKFNTSKANEIIAEELGPNQVGKFIVVWDDNNNMLFESDSARMLGIRLPRTPKTLTLTTKDHLIRAINFDLKNYPGRTMQLGIIVDKGFIDWSFLNKSVLVYIIILLLLLSLAAAVFVSWLLRPVRLIADELRSQIEPLLHRVEFDLEKIDLIASRFPEGRRDEFGDLIGSIRTLMLRINTNLKFQKVWAFQMAHEIKTPLFLASEALSQPLAKMNEDSLESARNSLRSVNLMINDFLGWAEVATLQSKPTLYANKVAPTLERVLGTIDPFFPNRIQREIESDFVAVCNPVHLDQLLNNLLMNALKHTSGPVRVRITEKQQLIIQDFGSGIDPKILEKMGSPFNKGNKTQAQKGSGLGLAWIKALTDLYQWQLQVETSAAGTTFTIHFPQV
jgi:signal transduction histidine kinase